MPRRSASAGKTLARRPFKAKLKLKSSKKHRHLESDKSSEPLRKSHFSRKIDTVDLSGNPDNTSKKKRDPLKSLNQLHQSIVRHPSVPTLSRNGFGNRKKLQTETTANPESNETNDRYTDFDNGWLEDLPPFTMETDDADTFDTSFLGAKTSNDASLKSSVEEFPINETRGYRESRSRPCHAPDPEPFKSTQRNDEHRPSQYPYLRTQPASTRGHATEVPYLEVQIENQTKRGTHSRSPSPASKRPKTGGKGEEVDLQAERPRTTVAAPLPSQGMEGIDPEIFAQFKDIIEFVD